MPLYIRKGIRVGPFRFNLSKSGVGVSLGVTGLRIGTGPRGAYVHAGRGGLYYRQSLGGRGRGRSRAGAAAREESSRAGSSPRNEASIVEEVDSGCVLQMQDVPGSSLLDEIRTNAQRPRLVVPTVLAAAGALGIAQAAGAPLWGLAALFALAVAACAAVGLRDLTRRTTVVFYEIDDEATAPFARLFDAFEELRRCSNVWTVEARQRGLDPRYHGGADSTDRRSPIQPATGSPPSLRLNLDAPLLPAGRQLLAFLPDRLLVFEGSKVGAVAYPDLRVAQREVRFIEPGTPPLDATVVERTWRHVNKSGEPDRRFRENPEMAVCAYDEIELSSDSGLREVFQFSRRGAARGFAEALRDLGRVGDPAG